MKNPSRRQAVPGFEQLSFLPAPEFNPVWPKSQTLPDRCLLMMLGGQSLTHREFLDAAGSWRLAAVVYTLRELGWPIESEEIPAPIADAAERYIARYYLDENVAKQCCGGVAHG